MKNRLLLLLLSLVFFSCEEAHLPESPESSPVADSKEVLLVGTFHYNNPGADVAKTKSFDILSEKSQAELQTISSKIKDYKPSKLFVEWPYDEQAELDSLYQLYLQNQYFTNDSLSDFYRKNEIFQLAFRVGKANKLPNLYAIDYSTPFPFGEVMNDVEQHQQTALKATIEDGIAQIIEEFDNKIDSGYSLADLTYFLNSSEHRSLANNWHNNLMLLAGGPDDLAGPTLTSEWYKRNLFMWSFIQKRVGHSDEKIMVLVGSSHAAMLEMFIENNDAWQVRELRDVMGK